MSTSDLLLHLDDSTVERLYAESQREGRTSSELAEIAIEEWLRMQAHPGIVFRSGPAGRRAGLAGGPDIWEFARVVQAVEGTEDETLERIAEFTSLRPYQAGIALRYYKEYRDEIDESIRRRIESSERRRAAWLQEQAQLQS